MSRWIATMIGLIAILIALALIGYLSGNWEDDVSMRPGYRLASAETKPEACVINEEAKEKIQAMMLDALDDAFRDQIKLLFGVWMKDSQRQPERARVGTMQAISAHQTASVGVLQWVPPVCVPGK
jgi:hypothetical protein